MHAASSDPPDLVVIYAGSNDFTNRPAAVPSNDSFIAAYERLVALALGGAAGGAAAAAAGSSSSTAIPVVHICGVGDVDSAPCALVEQVAARGGPNATFVSTGDAQPKGGCQGHRNATQQAALAARLTPVLAAAAGWA